MKKLLVLAAVVLAGCGTAVKVRQVDLDSWVGVPVAALDMHSLFITIPLYKTRTDGGVEVRNYANSESSDSCYRSGGANLSKSGNYVSSSTFTSCSSNKVVCNNIFYIKDGKVIEYAPTGQCYTDETVQPQKRYLELMNK
jgi:hypothetical protein